jgi:LmbE family N-acetylglucosaminyl deacetylase
MRRSFAPDNRPETEALRSARTLAIGAHADDLEFMNWYGIAQKGYAGVIVTEGGDTRWQEQQRAATLGGYALVIGLGVDSAEIKKGRSDALVAALAEIMRGTDAGTIYTHNLLDRHDTHVSVALHVIAAARLVPPRPIYGCEVWRSLDWLSAEDRVAFDVSGQAQQMAPLMAAHKSQLAGKRYDSATIGRKRANATFAEAYDQDRAESLELAIDLTPLVKDPTLDVHDFAMAKVARFADDASARIRRWKS